MCREGMPVTQNPEWIKKLFGEKKFLKIMVNICKQNHSKMESLEKNLWLYHE